MVRKVFKVYGDFQNNRSNRSSLVSLTSFFFFTPLAPRLNILRHSLYCTDCCDANASHQASSDHSANSVFKSHNKERKELKGFIALLAIAGSSYRSSFPPGGHSNKFPNKKLQVNQLLLDPLSHLSIHSSINYRFISGLCCFPHWISSRRKHGASWVCAMGVPDISRYIHLQIPQTFFQDIFCTERVKNFYNIGFKLAPVNIRRHVI